MSWCKYQYNFINVGNIGSEQKKYTRYTVDVDEQDASAKNACASGEWHSWHYTQQSVCHQNCELVKVVLEAVKAKLRWRSAQHSRRRHCIRLEISSTLRSCIKIRCQRMQNWKIFCCGWRPRNQKGEGSYGTSALNLIKAISKYVLTWGDHFGSNSVVKGRINLDQLQSPFNYSTLYRAAPQQCH